MEEKYSVIGGQYEDYCYDSTVTLAEAKKVAVSKQEYWDNWQGWHVPVIYKIEDTEMKTNFYGLMRCAKENTIPVAWATYDSDGKIVWHDLKTDADRIEYEFTEGAKRALPRAQYQESKRKKAEEWKNRTPQYQLNAAKKYQAKFVQIHIHVTEDTKTAWTKAAKEQNKSLTQYIIDKVNK